LVLGDVLGPFRSPASEPIADAGRLLTLRPERDSPDTDANSEPVN
jgi:hypothetical protein